MHYILYGYRGRGQGQLVQDVLAATIVALSRWCMRSAMVGRPSEGLSLADTGSRVLFCQLAVVTGAKESRGVFATEMHSLCITCASFFARACVSLVLSLVSCILGVCPRDLVSRNMSSTTRLFGHLLLRQRCRIIHDCREFYERVLPSLENQAETTRVSPVLTMQIDLCHPQPSLFALLLGALKFWPTLLPL